VVLLHEYLLSPLGWYGEKHADLISEGMSIIAIDFSFYVYIMFCTIIAEMVNGRDGGLRGTSIGVIRVLYVPFSFIMLTW